MSVTINNADFMNARCAGSSLDRAALLSDITRRLSSTGIAQALPTTHPHLFADTPLFVSAEVIAQLTDIVAAAEAVLTRTELAAFDPGYASVFSSYDFHLTANGPRLIEINTNAGGGMLCVVQAAAQTSCCAEMAAWSMGPTPVSELEATFVNMFRDVWHSARGDAPLRCIAIVDEQPLQQYLYPEFLLFQELFTRHGIHAVIADPGELESKADGLYHGATGVDLIYNRLTDFDLHLPQHAVLRDAYLQHRVVLTPHSHAHACYADKRRLCLLSDADRLQARGVSATNMATLLAGVPRTVAVDEANAAGLWSQRRRWFFKPVTGYGGKAAYRGDKLTTRVWEEILKGAYVAQELVPPSARAVRINDADVSLKVDLRAYVYRSRVQWIAARLYQGQTTNFRTPGGGFSPVYSSAWPTR